MVFGSKEGAMPGSLLFGGSRREKILSHYSEPYIPAPQLKTKRLCNPSPNRLQPITERYPYMGGERKENIRLEIALVPKLLENGLNSIESEYWYMADGEILMSN
jgi:hypothetical protein